ncbi:MAG: ATP-binding protein [Wenzhouxiangellaceae bacterium]
MKKSLPFYLTTAQGAKLSDLSTERIDWFVTEASAKRKFSFAKEPTPNNVLAELGLLDKRGVVNAALMLFGKDPQRYCPAAVVKCSHYHGTDVVRPIPSHQVFGKTLFEQADDAADFVLSRLDRTIGDREQTTAAEEKLEVPKEAIREIIVNAVIHRDYDSNASVQIGVFADRLEIMNPGGLPDGLTVDDLVKEHLSVPVNPFLARPFYLAGYINQLGYGTRNVVKWCRKVGLPVPTFDSDPRHFRAVIWRNWLTDERIKALELNDRQAEAIQLLKTALQISNSEYQKLTGVSRATAKRDLEELVKMELIELEGAGRAARYRLIAKRLENDSKGSLGAGT